MQITIKTIKRLENTFTQSLKRPTCGFSKLFKQKKAKKSVHLWKNKRLEKRIQRSFVLAGKACASTKILQISLCFREVYLNLQLIGN